MPPSDLHRVRQDRLKQHMDAPYLSNASPGVYPGPGNAVEYIAYQLGMMRHDVARIASALEKIAAKPER